MPTQGTAKLPPRIGLISININYLVEFNEIWGALSQGDLCLRREPRSHSETTTLTRSEDFPVKVHNWALPSLIILTQIEIKDYFSIIFNYL